MSDHNTLLVTILENPADNTARLVLADLLRESEDVEQQALGRFMWAGVTAAAYHEEELVEDRLFYTAQAEIAAVASAGFPARWFASLGVGPSALTKRDWLWDSERDRVTVRIGDSVGACTRGLLSELSVTLGEWYAIAQGALAVWPIERVTITDVPGLTFTVMPDTPRWNLSARLKVPRRRVPLLGTTVPAAMSAAPALTEDAAEWRVEEQFATRADLVLGAAPTSAELVSDLRCFAGDRWPSPPRKRR